MRTRRQPNRRGAVTVEAAVCLPVLAMIVFGAIQACDVIHLRHLTTLAAYEGTLVACKENATRSDVIQRAGEMLTALGVTGGTVAVDPNVESLSALDSGQQVTVTVTAPVTGNLSGPAFFTTEPQVQSSGVTAR